MPTQTNELQDILQTIQTLQARVHELAGDESASDASAAVAAVPADFLAAPRAMAAAPPAYAVARGDVPPDLLSLLRAGVAELATMSQLKEFPEYFVRLARRTGLRLLLIKRWTSGLQVILEENAKLPAEAKQKRSDGRAPIPATKDDIFTAVAEEAVVYGGPVPVKHFPLDLTILLGRGSRDRQIIVLPLPSQKTWNSFLYFDADKSTEKVLAVAEVLANYALARMCLLNKGMRTRQGLVASIRRAEIHRRQEHQAKRAGRPAGDEAASDGGLGDDEPTLDLARGGRAAAAQRQAPPPVADLDPFAGTGAADAGDAPAPAAAAAPSTEAPAPERGRARREPVAATAADLPDTPAWDDPDRPHQLAPEVILRHSGELPALPKAACHIMAVIEDPRTTATKLEKALAMDQALTAKVLRIANSPFYGAVREISTVSESIVRLGFVTIRNWTLVTAARSVFLAPGASILYQKIWRQSVLSAMAGQMVAQAVGRTQPEAVFIGGLMQNIGQLVLARSHPELFQEILSESAESGRPYHVVERHLLGFDHGELGALLLQEWNLSRDLEDAVRWHHRFNDPDARNARVAAMIALGEEIAWCHSGEDNPASPLLLADPGDPESEDQLLSEAGRHLGLTPGRVGDLIRQAGELKIDPHFFN